MDQQNYPQDPQFNQQPAQPQQPYQQPAQPQQPYQQPAQPYQQPAYQQPAQPYQQPAYQQPAQPYQQPVYQQPAQPYQQPVYQQPGQPYQQPYQQPYGPVRQLKTNKALWKVIVFSIITFGIYPLVCFSSMGESINTAASRYDGKKTMHFCLLTFIIAPITFGIAAYVWYHKISNRMGNELQRRGIGYSFGASDFWLWGILGSIIIVGPFVYIHKMCKACNLICDHYNHFG